jgi:hypothetical protein
MLPLPFNLERPQMNEPRKNPSVEITPATPEQQPALSNLYQLYIHDFTDFGEQPLGDGGRFKYDPLSPYWTDPDRHPFLVWMDGKLAGFALVEKARISPAIQTYGTWPTSSSSAVHAGRVSATRWRKGYGSNFRGPGKFRVMPKNVPPLLLWRRAISRFIGEVSVPDLTTKDD